MRKTNSNIKRARFLKRVIICFIVVQSMILCFFAKISYDCAPIESNDSVQKQIVVDEVEHIRVPNLYNNSLIYSGNDVYKFVNLGIWGEYTAAEFSDAVSKGDTLNIIYTERYGIFGKYNLVMDARNSDAVYLDFDYYKNQRESLHCTVLIMFFVLETLLLSFFVCYVVIKARKMKFNNIIKKRK